METTTTNRLEAYIAEKLSSLGLSRPRLGDHEAAPQPRSTARQPRTKSPPWEPSCTHSAMTVIYHEAFKCRNCGRQSPFGWVYRCVVDTDPLILGAHDRGDPVAIDSLGSRFADGMGLGRFGPDARSEEESFLKMTAEQLTSYTEEQAAALLIQRANVRKVIANERSQTNHRTPQSAREKYPDDDRPWMPNKKFECQYKACHSCYPLGRQKSWINMDAVVNGDILPHLATGYSFSLLGTRPVVDANVVRNLGCHVAPLPLDHPATAQVPPEDGTPPSTVYDPDTAMQNSSNAYSTATSSANGSVMMSTSLLAVPRNMPSQHEEIHAADFLFEFEYSEYTLACCTPLPAADLGEDCFLVEHGPASHNDAGEDHHFEAGPLGVGNGLALTEEAVESGTADVVRSIDF